MNREFAAFPFLAEIRSAGPVSMRGPGLRRGRLQDSGTFFSSVLCALLLFALAGCGPISMSEEQHQARALELEDAGNLAGAIVEWKNVLQLNPANSYARVRLGAASLELGDLATASAELQRAADLGVNSVLVAEPLARLHLLEGRPERVLAELNLEHFKEGDTVDKVMVLRLRGEALTAMGQLQEARKSLYAALELEPEAALTHVSLAGLEVAEQHLSRAREHLLTALEIDPSLHRAWSLLAEMELQAGRPGEADKAFSEAIANAPNPFALHMRRASVRLALEDLDGFQSDLTTLQRLNPQAPGTQFIQGLWLLHQGLYSDAQSAFEQALSQAPDFAPALLYLGASYLAQDRFQSAQQAIERYLQTNPESDEATRLLAELHLRTGNLARAQALLQAMLVLSPEDSGAHFLLGRTNFALTEYDAAIDRFRTASKLQPHDPAARIALAESLLAVGKPEAGLQELTEAIEDMPGEQRLHAARFDVLLKTGQYELALKAIERADGTVIEGLLRQNLLAAAYLGLGDVDRARAALEVGLDMVPGDPETAASLARLALSENRVEEAQRIYRAVLAESPGHLDTTMRLAELLRQLGDLRGAQELLQEAVRRHPDTITARLALARHLMQAADYTGALAVLEPMQGSAGNDPLVLESVYQAQLGLGQTTQALTTLRALARNSADTPESIFRVALAFEAGGYDREAKVWYGRVLEHEPLHFQALSRLAALTLRDGQHAEAMRLAKRMQADETLAATGHTLEARVLGSLGDYDAAILAYRRAQAIEPSTVALLGLSSALQQSGRVAEAIQTLRLHLSHSPDDAVVRLSLAKAFLMKGEADAAVGEYERVLAVQPDSSVALNNLAVLYQDAGDSRALEYAERAHERDPGNPSIADTLGWILVKAGDVERGLKLLELARKGLPHSSAARYHYAAGLALAGRNAEAGDELDSLLAEFDSFAERADAEALLKTLR